VDVFLKTMETLYPLTLNILTGVLPLPGDSPELIAKIVAANQVIQRVCKQSPMRHFSKLSDAFVVRSQSDPKVWTIPEGLWDKDHLTPDANVFIRDRITHKYVSSGFRALARRLTEFQSGPDRDSIRNSDREQETDNPRELSDQTTREMSQETESSRL
jgi:hypothetical protein